MYTTEFSCYGLRKLHSKRLAVLIGFAICAFVFYAVNIYLGSRTPKDLKGATPYFLAATLLLIVWALVIYFRKRFKINIYGDAKKLELEIQDPELNAPIILSYPFKLRKQWIRIKNGKAHIKELYLTFLDQQNEPIMTLTASLGDLHDAPSRFDYVDFMNKEDRTRLKLSEQMYSTKVKDIENMLNIHLNYLNSRNND